MGSVFEALHEYLGSAVALKFLNPELAQRPGLVARFLQEARVSASIRTPYVVQVSDVDQTADGLPYLVMELLEGESLQAVLHRSGKLPRQTALDFAVQILNGLEVAHAKGVVHRDLKPDNVFVVSTAQGPLLKLLDFGIAKLRTSEEFQKGLTRPGVLMGTPEYMAPEQAISADTADARADLFSVGVLLFEMLAGARPVSGDDPRVIAASVLAGQVRSLRELDPDAPEPLVAIVHRALSGRPNDRFQRAVEMRSALLPLFTLSLNASGAVGYPSHLQATPTPAIASAQSQVPARSDRPPPTQPDAELAAARAVPPTLPPSEPQAQQPAPMRTGTVLGGPVEGGFGPTAEMSPMAFDPTSPGGSVQPRQVPPYPVPPMQPAPRKKKRSALSILGIIAAVCGALAAVGVIATLIAINRSDSSSNLAPPIAITPPPPVTTVAPIDTLTTTQTTQPPAVPVPTSTQTATTPPAVTTHHPPPADAGVGDAGDAGGFDAGFPTLPPFPSAIPSGLIPPFPPLPSGLPPLPSGLPTFPIPGWPPPP